MSGDDTEDDEHLRRSVLQLLVVSRRPNYYQPWELMYQHTSSGSGCVIDGRRILTNAHVVAHHVYVQAMRPGDPEKYTARVLSIDHDRETALLTVDDPSFFDGMEPVRFGGLPSRNDKVVVYGFPSGGRELCATAGIVSRVEIQRYTHSHRELLAIQTDAAINPGNSGGPVFRHGELVGVAFQGHTPQELERVGYVIPVSIVQNMLDDLANGAIEGVPDLGVHWQKIENRALREHLRLPATTTGVMITRVVEGSSATDRLREGDVLAALDGEPIACDGSVLLRGHERVHFSHLVSRHQIGETVRADIVRGGEPATVAIELRAYTSLVPPPRPGQPATYLVFAGFVFVPLTYDYMNTWKSKDHPYAMKHWYYDGQPTKTRREVVLISHVLAHDINVGYHQIRSARVERVNGVDIGDMRDLVRALGEPQGGLHVFEIDYPGPRGQPGEYHSTYGTRVVIAADRVVAATAEIMAANNIARDRSPNL